MNGTPIVYEPTLVVVELSCVQCDAGFVAVYYASGSQRKLRRLALLPRFKGRGHLNAPHARVRLLLP